MSANRYREHLLILPEDDAYEQILVGFVECLSDHVSRRVQILPLARGFEKALTQVLDDEHQLRRYPLGRLLVVIDFDNVAGRRESIAAQLTTRNPELADRIFFIGSLDEAEDLVKGLGRNKHAIGAAAFRACEEQIPGDWDNRLLAHNQPELTRLSTFARPLLFGA
jgi:hypothetical protein